MEIEDTMLLGAVIKAMPAMKKRLLEDAKISPAELLEATEKARAFIKGLGG